VPRLMWFKRKVCVVFIGFLVSLVWSAPSGAAPTRSELTLVSAINQVRAANGLEALRIDPRLQRAARSHSRDMVRRSYFAHGPVGQRLVSFGVRAPKVGENLAWGTGALARASAVISHWLASPAHRANLLRPGFRRVGIGRVLGRFGGRSGAAVITADFAGR
jgi:uncharacterized protein YkwD